MAHEPKKRHSKSAKRKRRASISLKKTSLVTCPNCREAALPHQVCKNCGFYAGKKVSGKTQVKVVKA